MHTFLKHIWKKIFSGGPKPENFRRQQRLQLLQLLSSAQSLLPWPLIHLGTCPHQEIISTLPTRPRKQSHWEPKLRTGILPLFSGWLNMASSPGNGGGGPARWGSAGTSPKEFREIVFSVMNWFLPAWVNSLWYLCAPSKCWITGSRKGSFTWNI